MITSAWENQRNFFERHLIQTLRDRNTVSGSRKKIIKRKDAQSMGHVSEGGPRSPPV